MEWNRIGKSQFCFCFLPSIKNNNKIISHQDICRAKHHRTKLTIKWTENHSYLSLILIQPNNQNNPKQSQARSKEKSDVAFRKKT